MSEVGIEDEVRATLRELLEEVGAVSARIVEHDDLRTGVPARTLARGGGEYLRVELPTRVDRSTIGPPDLEGHARPGANVEAAFERATRQLRAIRRRWEAARLPEVTVVAGTTVPTGDRITERIEHFLKALTTVDRVTNAFVTSGTKLVGSARAPDEVEASRWPFLARRALSTHAPGSSHGEVVDPDAYAMSFWYDAALVVLLADPYAIDFVRHRCRQVARELANLLPLLEPDPEAPAAIRRRPPTLP
ncbi:MAG: hypothetical protein H0T89_12005 [Deltaproteobacteria bacterium]|nr:hypothetical protein [Deltaproteobacteria bacterium]